MLDVCCDPTLYYEYRTMSIHGNLCYGGLLRGTRCMRKLRRSMRWLWHGVGGQSTLRVTGRDLAQTERTH